MGKNDKPAAVRKAAYYAAGCFALGAVVMALAVAHGFRVKSALPDITPPEITVTSLEMPGSWEEAGSVGGGSVRRAGLQCERESAKKSPGGPAPMKPLQAEALIFYTTPEIIEPVILPEEVTEPEVNVIENCVITYYCAERYAHICGTGDGITATGAEATPGVTCAVDPAVIPFGSIVCVDYGDGVLHEYIAQDSGAWVNEDHVDLCVGTHDEALALGKKTATVYWSAPDTKPSECGGMPERQVTAQERCDWLPELIQGSSSEMNGLSALDGNEGYATCENEAAVYWEAA